MRAEGYKLSKSWGKGQASLGHRGIHTGGRFLNRNGLPRLNMKITVPSVYHSTRLLSQVRPERLKRGGSSFFYGGTSVVTVLIERAIHCF